MDTYVELTPTEQQADAALRLLQPQPGWKLSWKSLRLCLGISFGTTYFYVDGENEKATRSAITELSILVGQPIPYWSSLPHTVALRVYAVFTGLGE